MAKDKTIVISDLHIDTWKNHQVNGKPKIDYFIRFIEQVVKPEAANLVINGDILDAPPAEDEDVLPMYREVIELLVKLTATTNVYYFVGNHDIGLWGLSVSDYRPLSASKKLNIIYPREPQLLVRPDEGNDKVFLYFEHGHFYDPFLGVYVAKVAGQTYPLILRLQSFIYRLFGLKRSSELLRRKRVTAGQVTRDVFRAAQRRDRAGAKSQPNGLSPTRRLPWWKALWNRLTGRPTEKPKDWLWRLAAGDVFRELCASYPEAEVKAVVFGHTHVPDFARISCNDKQTNYLNSGDWSAPTLEMGGYSDNSSFIVFDRDGNVIDRDGNVIANPDKRAVRDFISESGTSR